MGKQKPIDKAGFITKASAIYCDQFFARAKIQLIPGIGGALDTLLSGLGAKYQYQRLEHFISILQERLKHIEQINSINSIEPSEELFDFMMQNFDQVVRTRSAEKMKRFANLVINQVMRKCNWEEAETACRLLTGLTDTHIQILDVCLEAQPCDGVFDSLKIVTFSDPEKSVGAKVSDKMPLDIRKVFPKLSSSILELLFSELIAKGLIHDEGIGRWSTGNMTFFIATDMAQWLISWICETTEIAKKK